MTWITSDWDFYELLWPQIFRGIGLMLSIIPINDISLGTLPPERLKNASGLFNLMRNLGGAFGLAGLTTVLNDRTDLHLARLHEAITWSRVLAMKALSQLTQRFQSFGSDAQAMALKQLMQITHRQGVVMAFSDVFLLLSFPSAASQSPPCWCASHRRARLRRHIEAKPFRACSQRPRQPNKVQPLTLSSRHGQIVAQSLHTRALVLYRVQGSAS